MKYMYLACVVVSGYLTQVLESTVNPRGMALAAAAILKITAQLNLNSEKPTHFFLPRYKLPKVGI